ncbi:MAG TPA: amidohydrolase [Blastocatellia bacterium]|nr:amidohydrolase [Blastocatellia bacterium]
MTRLISLIAITLPILVTPVSLPRKPPTADLLLVNARVVTMNPRQPSAEAVAIKDGRIVWVGTTAEATKRYHDPARTIDLAGATVLPGIIDAHTHLMSLGESFLKLNLKDVATPEEAAASVRHKAATVRPGEWILGWGWDEGKWASHYPTHEMLSDAAPNNPVLLTGLHSFASWVNKKALDLAGITKDSKDPENGKIIRDEKTGEPAGVLTNRAQELVARHIPPLDLERVKQALELAARECVRNGLTSVHEARVTPLMIQAFRELIKEGRMPLRVYLMLDGANKALVDEWLARGPEIDSVGHRLTIRSVKVFADGALGSRGAALFEPYTDAPNTKGLVTTSEADIYNLTRRCLRGGFQVATHAIGDAGNHLTLDAFEKALRETGAKNARLRVEHAQVLGQTDIPRFAKLGVIASMQPTHCTSDMPWAEKRVGPVRIKGAYAWRSVLKTGAHVPVSSDFPGETLNPFYGIYAAVTRQDPEGRPEGGWYPGERMTLQEALRGYTIEAAYSEFEEREKGSIEKGKLADLIVISKDITKVAPKEMLTIRVLKTIIGGEIVYSAER